MVVEEDGTETEPEPTPAPVSTLSPRTCGLPQGRVPTDRLVFDNYKLSLGEEVGDRGPDPHVIQLLSERLRGTSAVDRVKEAWRLGASDRRVVEGARSHQEPGPSVGSKSIYVVLNLENQHPFATTDKPKYFQTVKDEQGRFKAGIVSRGFLTQSEAAAYCTGAGCLWHLRL